MRWTSFCGLLFAVWLSQGLLGQEGEISEISPHVLESVGYSVDYWNAEDGPPVHGINAIVQAADGYLWCATTEALVRFDGVRFTEFEFDDIPVLAGSWVTTLFCDRRGRLWIGGSGPGLCVYEDGVFRRLGEEEGFPSEWNTNNGGAPSLVWTFTEDENGDLLIKRKGHKPVFEITRFRDGQFTAEEWPAGNLRWPALGDLAVSGDRGEYWALAEFRGVVGKMAPGEGKSEQVELGEANSERAISRFFRSRDDVLSLVSTNGIHQVHDGRWKRTRSFPPVAMNRLLEGALEDAYGNYWFSAHEGKLYLSRGENRVERILLPEEFDLSRVSLKMEDRDGNLWGTLNDTLFRIRPNSFRSWGTKDGIAGARVISVVEDAEQKMWITSNQALYSLGEDDVTLRRHESDERSYWLALPSHLGGVYVVRFPPGNAGRSWELERWTASEVVSVTRGESLIQGMVEASDGTLWIGTSAGLLHHREGVTTTMVVNESPEKVASLAEDSEGRVVVAIRGGIYRLEDDRWKMVSPEEVMKGLSVFTIHVDEEGVFWFGGAGGLAVWQKGKWHRFGKDSGLPSEIWGMVTDALGSLWAMSNEGLVRISRDSLLSGAWGERGALGVERFGREDGLPTKTMGSPRSRLWRGTDGRIWIPTVLGLAVVDPGVLEERQESKESSPVYIESMLVDGIEALTAGPVDSGEVTLDPGLHQIDFRYAGVALGAAVPKNYRYRLIGHGSKWIDASDSRVAVYRRLPPGEYRFEVMLEDGQLPASVVFTIAPFWWQRPMARYGMVGVVLMAAGLGMWWRHRRTMARQARQESFSRQLISLQEEERRRVASELHDGLGQNLLLLKRGIGTVAENPSDVATCGKTLDTMGEIVDQSVKEVRGISHNLHPFQLGQLGLSKTLRQLVLQVSESTKLDITEEVDDIDGLVLSATEISIYRIVQEALSNVIRHSRASRAEVKLYRQDGNLVVEIQDDGCGFVAKPASSGAEGSLEGFGLRGMEERARIAGGRSRFQSAPREGTRLSFEFPVVDS